MSMRALIAGLVFAAALFAASMGLLVGYQVHETPNVGANAAGREQVMQACIDEIGIDTSSAETHEEYEVLVAKMLHGREECRRLYGPQDYGTVLAEGTVEAQGAGLHVSD